MRPAAFTKLQNLLYLGVKKSHRWDVRNGDNSVYINPEHSMAIESSLNPEIDETTATKYLGEYEDGSLCLKYREMLESDSRVIINRGYLLDVLQNMDSDVVIIYARSGGPIKVKGMLDDHFITAVICNRKTPDDIGEDFEIVSY